MSNGPDQSRRNFWLSRARIVRRRINIGWWLDSLSTPLLILSIAGAALFLWLRREVPAVELWHLATATGCVMLGLLGGCFLAASRRFETTGQSLVRIEAAMGLRNALSAANEGVTPWPEPVEHTPAGIHWHCTRLIIPLFGSLAFLAAGLWFPVTAKLQTASTPPEQPQAWRELSEELDLLAKEAVADESYIEQARERLDQLKSQEEEQWFSHSSLEATDSLREAHNAETRRVLEETERAGNALTTMEKQGANMAAAEQDRLLNEFDQALKGLQAGAMKPNPELLKQMENMDLENLADLTPEQQQQLQQNLNKHANALKQCQGCQGEDREDWMDELLAGDGEGDKPGQQPGRGGVNRGPGHDPNVLGNQKDKTETGDLTGIDAKDLSRAAPGDLLQLQNAEHEVDENASSLTAGGGIKSAGSGGDRVWRDSLDPDEQRAMKRFFE